MKKVLVMVALVMVSVIVYAFNDRAEAKQGKKEVTGNNGEVVVMNKEMFLKDVFDYEKSKEWKYKGDKPAIIDLYADWCGPCRQTAPIMKELAKEYEDQIVIYKVNVDNESELASALGIKNLPTILFIPKKGDPQVIVGSADKSTFKRAIDQVLLGKPAK
jgi:thioredoxin